jgi:4-hydroxybenzoate polyprenyltransferase
MLRIRRVEFLVAEIPIFLIPVLLSARGAAVFSGEGFVEGIVILYLLFNFGDIANCLSDRDLDAAYKPHLSRAVYELGVRFVAAQLAATGAAALLLAAHLAYRLERPLLVAMVAAGLALGAAYSLEPARCKGRGLYQIACLWLVIFVGPMAYAAALVTPFPPLFVLALSAAYATIQMGIILINNAEDYPEDRAAKVRTAIVALGLPRGVALAAAMTAGGGAALLFLLGALFAARGASAPAFAALLPPLLGCALASVWVLKLRRAVAAADEAAAIAEVKRQAKLVPVWLTVVAWTTLGASYVLFATGR